MKVVRCRCRGCRSGLRTRGGSVSAKMKVRAARRKARQDLRRGVEPEVVVVLGFTD